MPRITISYENLAKGERQENRVVLLLGSFSDFPEIHFKLEVYRPLPVFKSIAGLFHLNNGGAIPFLSCGSAPPLSLPLLETWTPTIAGSKSSDREQVPLSGASAGRGLNGLWINVLLLHYSLSFKGLPGGLSSLSIP